MDVLRCEGSEVKTKNRNHLEERVSLKEPVQLLSARFDHSTIENESRCLKHELVQIVLRQMERPGNVEQFRRETNLKQTTIVGADGQRMLTAVERVEMMFA